MHHTPEARMVKIACDWRLEARTKKTLFPEMPVTKKIFTRAAANFFFLISLIEVLKQSLHLTNYPNSTFLC